MTMDKRERVARAIAESDGHDWDACTESQRGEYLDNADAAIAALEPVNAQEAREEALREAAVICNQSYGGSIGDVHKAILALITKDADNE